jgi:DNA polymerase I
MAEGVLDRVQLHLVDNLDTLDQCRRWAGETRQGPLCIDTESEGLNLRRDRHRMTQLGDLNHGWAFGPAWCGAAHQIISEYTGRIGGFNMPYDWQVLEHWHGVKPRWERTDDAQLLGHLVDNLAVNALKPRTSMEIDSRFASYQKIMDEGMRKNGWTYATVPVSWDPYWMYGALDTVGAAHLINKFLPEVRAKFSAAYDLELAYARLCAKMMTAGMRIDVPYITEQMEQVTSWAAEASRWLREVHGLESPGSNEQVGRVLEANGVPILVRTPGGLPSIAKDTMAMYAATHPHAADLIRTIQGVVKAGKIVDSCLAKFLALAVDGVVHYSIHSTGAQATGRSSVTDPPMQVFDRDIPMIRGSFIPDPGWGLVSIDAAQIEARLCAHFSRDPQMIADFIEADRTGGHFFLNMAGRIYREQISKKDPRYTHTKNATYAKIYGSGLTTAAATAGISVEQMRPVYEGFDAVYPGVRKMMDRTVRENRRRNHRPQTRTLSGKRLYCQRGKEYALQDYRIQGSAADLMKHGGVAMEAAGLGEFMRITIHDEWMLSAPLHQCGEVLAEAERVLTDRDNFAVPIVWEGEIMRERWHK